MSWLARSIANTLMPADDEEENLAGARSTGKSSHGTPGGESFPGTPGGREEEGSDGRPLERGSSSRGVKEDLSELTKSLTRQFWGVASFLAPPPSAAAADAPRQPDPGSSGDPDSHEVLESPRIAGIRSDFAEIGGRFRSGISKLSSNKAVTEISKMASSFLPFGTEEDETEETDSGGGGAIGVTEEVLAFARNISMHPETWLDFPLFVDEDDSEEFAMSDAQREHALAVEHLEPRLAALRIELCPSHISEDCFWKIYFVLLHSRLNKRDADLLSTPQIVEAKARWLQELQNQSKRCKPQSLRVKEDLPYKKDSFCPGSFEEHVSSPSPNLYAQGSVSADFGEMTTIPVTKFETEKHPVQITEVKVVDKSIIDEEPKPQPKNKDIISSTPEISVEKDDEDGDGWLQEETGEAGNSGTTTIPIGSEEDLSFSDLEED